MRVRACACSLAVSHYSFLVTVPEAVDQAIKALELPGVPVEDTLGSLLRNVYPDSARMAVAVLVPCGPLLIREHQLQQTHAVLSALSTCFSHHPNPVRTILELLCSKKSFLAEAAQFNLPLSLAQVRFLCVSILYIMESLLIFSFSCFSARGRVASHGQAHWRVRRWKYRAKGMWTQIH